MKTTRQASWSSNSIVLMASLLVSMIGLIVAGSTIAEAANAKGRQGQRLITVGKENDSCYFLKKLDCYAETNIWMVTVNVSSSKKSVSDLSRQDHRVLKRWYKIQTKISPQYNLNYETWVKYQIDNRRIHAKYFTDAYKTTHSNKFMKIMLTGTMDWFYPKKKATRINQAMTDLTHYINLIYRYDWPAETAIAVMIGESHGRSFAVNNRDKHSGCRGSYGLFQIGCIWAKAYNIENDDLLDPDTNVNIAYRVYKTKGSFRPWSVYKKRTYKNYYNRNLLPHFYSTANFNWTWRK